MPQKILIKIDNFFIEKFTNIDANKPDLNPACFQECLSDWATILTSICKTPAESLTLLKKSIDENRGVLGRTIYTTILAELHQSIDKSPEILTTVLKYFSSREAYYTAWARFYDALYQKKNTCQILIHFEMAHSDYRALYEDQPPVELITTTQLVVSATKIVTNIQNTLSSSIQLSFEFSEEQIGAKSAKLIELNQLCNMLNKLGLPIKVHVPALSPLNHAVIANHLDSHIPNWRSLWKNFVEYQPQGSTTITSTASTVLKHIRHAIESAFNNQSFKAFDTLKPFLEALPKSALLMVRSTGKEDTADIANPGGNESIPAVALEEKAITKAVGDVVISYFSDKSLMQRLLSGDNITEPPFMPVLIQRMIGESFNLKATKNKHIVKSGVMYAQKNGIRIQLAPGHGELVVNSKGTFDSYLVTNENVVYPEIYRKPHRLVPKLISENGKMVTRLELHKNSKTLSDSPSLSLNTALAIAKVGRHIYKHFDMPMDIEFVYDERDNTLNLVQARPIPKGDVKAVIPSAIAPEKLPDIKKHSEIQNAFIITPAGYATHVITDKNQVIVADTIEQALTQYLKPQANFPTKIVIVKEIAPATSHAAAQFSTKAIPVFSVDDLQSVQEWLSNPFTIIADTQHKLLVKLANQITEKSLYDNETLKKGMFKSSLPSQLTLMPHLITPTLIDELFNFLTTQWPNIEIPQNNLFTFLTKQIELLESAKPQENTEKFIPALHSILVVFYRVAHQSKGNHAAQMLLRQAMITVLEIKHCLKRLPNVANTTLQEAQEEYLNLISKLEALIINPGNSQLFSNSLRQLAQEKKAYQLASKIDGFGKLSSTQKMYFVQFHKLTKLALNTKAAAVWNKFAMQCCQSQESTFQLAHLIQFNLKNKIAADWINNIALSKPSWIYSWILDNRDLNSMRVNSIKTSAELKALPIENTRTLLEAWEQNIPLWSDPKKFDKLWAEFHREFLPLFDKHKYSPTLSTTSQKIILKTVQDLTEIYDKTIKAVKGSCEYNPADQLKNFITLLGPYHNVMSTWVSYVPDALFLRWDTYIADGTNSKRMILEMIHQRFQILSGSSNVNQLNPSGNFCVASAKIGSTAAFRRQFDGISVTLEDMFTLFHQNILTSLALLFPNKIVYSQLPELIQPFLNEFKTLKTRPLRDRRAVSYEYEHSLECLSVTHEYPVISIDYNLPLRNHAAKFIIEYNQQTQQTQLHAKFFGGNWGNRMTVIYRFAYIEAQFLNIIEKRKIDFNESALAVEFTWGLSKEQTQDAQFSGLVKNIMRKLSELTFTISVNQEDYTELLSKYSPEQLMAGLKRYTTSPGTLLLNNERKYINGYILPKAIQSGFSLENCFTSSDLSEYIRDGHFDRLITKPYTLEKIKKFRDTYKIDLPWSAISEGPLTLLEEILLNGFSNEEFIQLIQLNNINLSDFSNLVNVIISINNYSLLDLLITHSIDLSNQHIRFDMLYRLYLQDRYVNLFQEILSKNLRITNADYLDDSQTYTTFINLVAPHLLGGEQATLFTQAILKKHDVAISALLAKHSKDEIIKEISRVSWLNLFDSASETLLKYVDYPDLLKGVEENIFIYNRNSSFCATVIATCLKRNLPLYPTLSQCALQRSFESYTSRVYLLPKLTVAMVLSLLKQYSDVDLFLNWGKSAGRSTPFLYELLKSEFDAQDFIELSRIAKFNTSMLKNIYDIILESKNDKLLNALVQQNIVFQNQSIKLQHFCDHFTNKELYPALVSLMLEPTRTIEMSNVNSLNLSEEFIKQFFPLLKPNEKESWVSQSIHYANASRMGLFSQQRPSSPAPSAGDNTDAKILRI